jgi:5-methylcytosine-specific restriction endonuclease McrA
MPAHMRPSVTLRRATQKPAKGSAAKARRARRAKIERAERMAKDAAKARDHWTCRRCGRSTLDLAQTIEAAHLDDKGMGGDHGLRSSSPADYVTLCQKCHQGPRSVHSGHVRMVFSTAMGDGPVEFVDTKIA